MVWSVSPAWEAVELTRGDRTLICLFVVLDPTDLGATVTTMVAPGQMPRHSLPSESSDADYLPH